MNTSSAFVYDIGLHDGSDTEYYLREGCRVVAVDANPLMCAAAEVRFSEQIRSGKLKVINCGVAESRGQAEFWVCDDWTQWSSFDRNIASRNGSKHHAIAVDCIPAHDIIHEFGVADYMKIDIEGNDRICIKGLTDATTPQYVSIEMDHFGADKDIRTLAALGYRDFKVICQNWSWSQVTVKNIGLYRWGPEQFAIRKLRRLSWERFRRAGGRGVGDSGPWGEKTSGVWHSLDHTLSVWSLLHEIDERLGGLAWWFDIHARK